MKGITGFRQGFGIAAVTGLLGLVLGFIALPLLSEAQTLPAVGISASPGTVCPGETVEIRWSSTNATEIFINNGIGSVNPHGERDVTIDRTTTFVITGNNSSGVEARASVTVNVNNDCGGDEEDLPSVGITASPGTICLGQSSELRWTSENTTSRTINQGIGSVSSNGNRTVSPSQTTTYTITGTNSSGTEARASVTVNVNTGGSCQQNNGQAPDVTTEAATNINHDDATLNGSVDANGSSTEVRFEYGTDRDDVEDGDADERTSWRSVGTGSNIDFDERIDDLDEDTTYYFRAVARNAHGTDYGNVRSFRTDDDDDDNRDRTCRDRTARNYGGSLPCRYDVVTNVAPPTVIIYADRTDLAYNGATFVRWSTVGATSCTATGGSSGWAGAKPIGPGSFYTGSLTSTRTYTLTCYNSAGSDTDSVTVSVRPRVVVTGGPTPRPSVGTSLVLVTSSIDRNQPIVPTLDNTRPRPGDEITYTVSYQNIGTAAITNLALRLDLPREVNYLYSTPANPTISGNTLIFNLGTLRANGSGTVTVRVRVREDAPAGALLNFPAMLSYIDPAGIPQTVTANVSAQVWTNPVNEVTEEVREGVSLAASVFGAGGFWPSTLFGWLLLLILVLLLIALVRYLLAGGTQGFARKTTTTTIQH